MYACIQTTLSDFSLDVELNLPGKGVTALYGPSGCGKTTLLRCIAGLQQGHATIRLGEQVWQDEKTFMPVHQRPLAYVFQEASLFNHLSVQANIEFGYRRIKPEERIIQPGAAIEWLGLSHLLNRRPEHLSGGERQRVAIARALLTSPRLLLMDEPLSSLDSRSKQDILPYLEQLHDTLAIPVIYVTHSPAEVAHLADHLVLLEAGRVLAQGSLAETLTRLDLPIRSEEDAGVVLEAVIAERDSQWHLARFEFEGGSLWARDPGLDTGHRVRLRILARDISLALEPVTSTSIQNIIPAKVEDLGADSHPSLALVRIRIGTSPLLVRLTRRSADKLSLQPGQSVWAQIKSAAVIE